MQKQLLLRYLINRKMTEHVKCYYEHMECYYIFRNAIKHCDDRFALTSASFRV
jgi:hypothetical protein